MEFLHKWNVCVNALDDLRQDIHDLLLSNGLDRVYRHTCQVTDEAVRIAEKFSEDESKAELAALLHDVGGVIPTDKRVEFLNFYHIGVLPEELEYPLIMHQKVSMVIAERYFNISDPYILSAIECHTTLKSEASKLDMIVFIADKIQWDQSGEPPYRACVENGLSISLERGALAYIEYLLENKSQLKVIHPWLLAAYNDLKDF